MTSGYHILGGSFREIEADVQAVGRVVSPWLWIFSVGGFALSVWDKWQIHQMYGSFRTMHRELRGRP